MHKKYSIVSILLLITIILPYVGGASVGAAPARGSIQVEQIAGKAGSLIEVPLLLKSSGDVTALQFTLNYASDVFELIEIKKGDDLNSNFQLASNTNTGKVAIGNLNSAVPSGSIEIAKAVYRISQTAVPRSYPIQFTDVQLVDRQANELTSLFDVEAGQVTVLQSSDILVTGVSISPSELNLTVGGAPATLRASVTPSTATNHQVTWLSSNTTVATVHNGVVTPVGAGVATITVKTEQNGYQASIPVRVASVTPTNLNLPVDTEMPTDTIKADVLVNGRKESIGTATTQVIGNNVLTTIAVDYEQLIDRLSKEKQGTTVTLPFQNDTDAAVGQLNGLMVKHLEQKEAYVEVVINHVTYTLPAQQLNIEDISAQLGESVNLEDIIIEIHVSTPTDVMLKVVESSAVAGQFSVIVPPMSFSVTARYGSTLIEVSAFNSYVERMFQLPDDVDPSKVSTGVVIDADGTSRHIPTQVIAIDGKYYAKLNSISNSTYTVIWNPISFKDTGNHWASEVVNNLGTRKVISGKSSDMFYPEDAMTRAEFAAIIVRALGLKPEQGVMEYSDVNIDDWYHEAVFTATRYHLITGYEDGTFRPTDLITREQAMEILTRAMRITGLMPTLDQPTIEAVLGNYSDASQVASWARSSTAASIQAGIVSGRTSNQLVPKATITRAEVAIIVHRLLVKSGLI